MVLPAGTEAMTLRPLPPGYEHTRAALQRVGTHVLARARHHHTGRFGLRVAPDGFGTPAFGPDSEVLRISATSLVRERTGETASTTVLDLRAAGLAEAAAFAGVDLDAPFDVGHDTPAVGDVEAPLMVEPAAAAVVAGWFSLAWHALDTVVADLGPAAAPGVIQLWPEHFDAATDVAVGPGGRVNLGASPGDGFSAEPYLYVGPWEPDRPGDVDYWNAPFGAAVTYRDVASASDPLGAATAFLRRGLDLLGRA
jgi:hypothetical protein